MKGWLGAIALLCCYEFFVARAPEVWTAVEWSKTGLHERITNEVIPTHRHARVVILGDSCARDAFDPVRIERELGWSRGEVANLAVTGGTMFDAELLYAAAREQMTELEVVVLCVEDHHLGPRTPTDIERRYASTADRLSDFDGETRNALLVGQVWQTLATSHAVRLRIREAWKNRDRRIPLGPDGRVVWRAPEDELEYGPENHDPHERLLQLYEPMQRHEGHLSELGQRPLHRLLDRLTEDGVEVWVLRLPRRPSFEEAAREAYPEVAEASRRGFEALAERHPAVFVADAAKESWTEPGVLGPRQFYDWGHATDSGARVLSDLLAERLLLRAANVYGASRTHAHTFQPAPPK